MTDDVSVVIPVYNGERYIEQAVRSALDQTLRPRECVVVDDGSTDGTRRVLQAFGDRITVVESPHAGVATARNLGVERASSRWVAFLDADDAWLPQRLERQLAALDGRDVALAYCGWIVCDELLNPLRRVQPPAEAVALRNTLLLEPPGVAIAQAGVVDRATFWRVGGFDPQLPPCEDADLVVRLAQDFPLQALPEELVLYRRHAGQASQNLPAMARGMAALLTRAFESGRLPADLQQLRGRAWANYHATVAAEHLARREWRQGGEHAVRAVASDPLRTAQLAGRRVRRVIARRPSAAAAEL